MASMTSIISFLILLLATYSYSAPVTSNYEFTTGKTMVGHETPVNWISWNGEHSTGVPNVQKPRSFIKLDSEESTTFAGVTHSPRGLSESNEESTTFGGVTHSPRGLSESNEESTTFAGVTHSPRGLSESSEESSTMESEKREFDEFSSSTMESEKREFDEFSSSTVEPVKRGLYQYSTSGMETATKFNGRAIGEEENVESFDLSTPFSVEEQPEAEKHVQPSSSADSFGISTDLLDNESPNKNGKISKIPKPDLVQTIDFPSGDRITSKIYETSEKKQSSQSASKTSEIHTSYTSKGNPEFESDKKY